MSAICQSQHLPDAECQRSTPQTHPEGEPSDLKQTAMLEQVSTDAPSKRGLFQRVYLGKASPRQCIKAQCLQCCWMDEAAIRECADTACPLHRLRPFGRITQ